MQIPIFPGLIISVSRFFTSSILRRFYNVQRLSDLIEIKVSSEPAGLTVICSELPRANVWVEISNRSPFRVTVHELEIDFCMPERLAKFVKVWDVDIKAGASDRLFIETYLTGKQVEYIRKHNRCQTATLKVNGLLSCRLSSIKITDREITAKKISFVDCGDFWKRFIH